MVMPQIESMTWLIADAVIVNYSIHIRDIWQEHGANKDILFSADYNGPSIINAGLHSGSLHSIATYAPEAGQQHVHLPFVFVPAQQQSTLDALQLVTDCHDSRALQSSSFTTAV